jgi:threonine synthase
MRAHFVVGRGFPAPPDYGAPDRISSEIVAGTYGAAIRAGEDIAQADGWSSEGGFRNWARREGAKLAYLEAFWDLSRTPDVVVQAVSSGLGVLGADKAAREFSQATGHRGMPRYVLAQEESCAPMVSAFRAGRRELADEDVVDAPTGSATAILHGDPRSSYPYIADLVGRRGGQVVGVSTGAIAAARHRLRAEAGITACNASAAALAGLVRAVADGAVPSGSSVLVMVGGAAGAPAQSRGKDQS